MGLEAQEEAEDIEMMQTPILECGEICIMYETLTQAFEIDPFIVPEGCRGCPNLKN